MDDEIKIKHQTTGLPFVTLKLAQTLDGNIATVNGDSKWITSKASRKRGHQLRADAGAILVGRGTVIGDDPELSVRYVEGPSPTKIVLDSQLKISVDAKIYSGAPLIVATGCDACTQRLVERKNKGAQIWRVPERDGRLDLKVVLQKVADAGLLHVLIEGGSQIAASALKAGLVDRLAVFVAPKILGKGLPSVGDLNIVSVAESVVLENMRVEKNGDDFLFIAQVQSQKKS